MIAAPLMNEADCLARQLRTKTPPQRTTTAAPERLPRERLSPLAEIGLAIALLLRVRAIRVRATPSRVSHR